MDNNLHWPFLSRAKSRCLLHGEGLKGVQQCALCNVWLKTCHWGSKCTRGIFVSMRYGYPILLHAFVSHIRARVACASFKSCTFERCIYDWFTSFNACCIHIRAHLTTSNWSILNLNVREYQMSCGKCIKLGFIQVLNGPAIFKRDNETSLRVHISHKSTENTLALVVVIVHYVSYIQNSLLTTNQDFHTQVWQKIRCCTVNANRFNSGPASHRMRACNSFKTHSSHTFGFGSHVHHSNPVPSNGASTTRPTSANACCTHVRAHLTA